MTEAKPLPLGVPAFKPIPIASHQETFSEILGKNEIKRNIVNYSQHLNNQEPIRRISEVEVADVTKNTIIQSMISPLAHVSVIIF